MKQNDYLLNIIANQDFTNEDLALVGLDATNTSLESKDKYKSLEYIQNQDIFQTDGKFDETKFDAFHDAVSIRFNEFTTLEAANSLGKNLAASKYNIFAEPENINPNPEFLIHKTYANPLRQKSSLWGGNQLSEGEFSVREIAQSQLTDNEGKWEESPNEKGFFGDFFDTKVLATYDSDGTHTDLITGQEVAHKKGDYKINHNGTFYYESLGDRDIYGKQVLSKFDVLTKDGSAWNEYDFFDSDDKEKNTFGTLMKSIVKVIPAFIPYVGPWYIAARIGINSADLFAKIGKITTGSDSPTLSAIEGFVASLGTSTSDYAQEHLWSLENILNMGSDVFLQLAEQRWLFTHLPSLLRGNTLGFDKKAQEAWQKKTMSDYMKSYNARKATYSDVKTALFENHALTARAVGETNRVLESILKENYKLGEKLSKAYMVGITSADTYGEAKAAGASDLEASLFTIGFAAGEYGILSTKLGDWILPELRLEKARLRKVIAAAHNQKPSQLAPKSEQLNWAKKLIQAGKDWFKGAGVDEDTGKVLAKHVVSNALGEGIEETTEQAWLDISKSLFNFSYDLFGSDTYLRPTWRDPNGNLNITNTLNDYALNFVGGAIGGGLGNLLPSFREASKISNISNNKEAYQELLYHIREGNANKLKKVASEMQLGDPTKGTSILDDYTYSEATESDNQDIQAKAVFNAFIDRLDQLVQMETDVMSDSGISLNLVFKDLRFGKLLESNILADYLKKYHVASSDLIALLAEQRNIQESKKDSERTKTDSADKTGDNDPIQNLEERIKKQREIVAEYTDGTQGKEFILDALFEMEEGLSNGYTPTNIIQYIQMRDMDLGYNRHIYEIPKEDIEKYSKEWENKTIDYSSNIRAKRKLFDYYNQKFNESIKNHLNDYLGDLDVFIGKATQETERIVDQHLEDSEQDFTSFLNSLYSNRDNYKTTDTEFSKRVSLMKALVEELTTINPSFSFYKHLFNAVRMTESIDAIQNPEFTSEIVNGEVVKNEQGEISTYKNILQDLYYGGEDTVIGELVGKYNENFSHVVTQLFRDPLILTTVQELLKHQSHLSYTGRSYLKEFLNEFVSDPTSKDILIKTIDNIQYTPIQNLIDSLQISLNDKNLKFSTLIEALEKQAYKESSNGTLQNFGYPDTTWEQAIKHAENLALILSSHLSAALTNLNDPTLAFGYNYTKNYLDNSDEYVTYTEEGYNILAQDLYKQIKQLGIYKKMVQNNASQLLSSQYAIGAQQLYNIAHRLKLYFKADFDSDDSILKSWENSREFINILEELDPSVGDSDLSKLVSHGGILTTDQKDLFKSLKFKLDLAIFNFIQNNKSKNKDEFADLLLKIIPDDIKIENSQGDFVKNVDVHPKVLITYLAAHGSLSYGEFYKEYQEILKNSPQFVHSEAQMNLLFHEVSFMSKKEVWDKLQFAYNVFQQKQLADGKIDDKGNFLNDKDSKFNTSSSLIYPSMFLGTGLAGTGKSSANLTFLLQILKNIGNLTNNIALVHKTKEQAKQVAEELSKATGIPLDNFMIFDHESYIEYINPNIPRPTLTSDGVTVNPNDVVQNEDTQLWHYKNEQDLNVSNSIPSMVIVDETTNISYLDLLVHQAYLDTNGIRSIALGDFHQSTLKGRFNQNENLAIHPHNFVQTWNLVNSFRSTTKLNTEVQQELLQKSKDFLQLLEGVEFEGFIEPEYMTTPQYAVDSDGFYGVYAENIEGEISEQLKQNIQIMLDTAKDKEIFVLVEDPNHPLYTYLKSLNREDKLVFKNGVAQGQEADYAIVIKKEPTITNDYKDCQEFLQQTYTALSRARKGSIIVDAKLGSSLFKPNIKKDQVIKSILTPEIIKKFNEEELNRITRLLGNNTYGNIVLDYDIQESNKPKIKDLDQIKAEIKAFKEELKNNPESSFIPESQYNSWKNTINEEAPNDKVLQEQLKELEKYVNRESYDDTENFNDSDDLIKGLKNENPTRVLGPLYSFNSYLSGVTIGNDNKIWIVKGGLINVEEDDKDPSKWDKSIVGLKGLLKLKGNEGYYDSTDGVSPKAIKKLHQLYSALYQGTPYSNGKWPFIPDGYNVVLGFVNQNHTNVNRGAPSTNNAVQGTNHRISALVMDSDSKLVAEIPLYTLPNINALIDSYSPTSFETDEFKKLDPGEQLKLLAQDYPALTNLLNIYQQDTNRVFYLKKSGNTYIWEQQYDVNETYPTSLREVLGDTTKLIGINVLSQPKNSNGYYPYEPSSVTLASQVNSSKNPLGNIYVYPNAFVFGEDVQIEVNGVLKTIPSGKPFVIVSQNPDITNTQRIGFNELLTEVQNNRATILYINSPILSNVNDFITQFVEDPNILTSRTSLYKLAKSLVDVGNGIIQDRYYNFIKYIVDQINLKEDSPLTFFKKTIQNSGVPTGVDTNLFKGYTKSDKVTYGSVLRRLCAKVLKDLGIGDIAKDQNIKNLHNLVISKLASETLYTSFERKGDARFWSNYPYYQLDVTFDSKGIYTTTNNVKQDINVCGELRTCNELGDFTIITDVISQFNLNPTPPKPVSTPIQQSKSNPNVYKDSDGTFILYNDNRYNITLNISDWQDFTGTLTPNSIIQIDNTTINVQDIDIINTLLQIDNTLAKWLNDDNYIAIYFKDYQKNQDGTYSSNGKTYNFENRQMIEVLANRQENLQADPLNWNNGEQYIKIVANNLTEDNIRQYLEAIGYKQKSIIYNNTKYEVATVIKGGVEGFEYDDMLDDSLRQIVMKIIETQNAMQCE